MPAEIALINPFKRKRRARKAHAKRRTTRARRRTHTKRAKRRTVVVARRANPRARRHNPRHRRWGRIRAHKRRVNPRFSIGGITKVLIPAAVGGAGAVALDVALGYGSKYLPDFLTTGYGKVAIQIAGAFGLGMLASKVVGREKGNAVMMGALTVAAYSLIKTVVKQAAPSVPGLAGDGIGHFGAYMPNSLGYVNPAPMLQGDGMGAYMQPNLGTTGAAWDNM